VPEADRGPGPNGRELHTPSLPEPVAVRADADADGLNDGGFPGGGGSRGDGHVQVLPPLTEREHQDVGAGPDVADRPGGAVDGHRHVVPGCEALDHHLDLADYDLMSVGAPEGSRLDRVGGAAG